MLGALLAVPLAAAMRFLVLHRPAHAQGRLGHPAPLRRARRAERPRDEGSPRDVRAALAAGCAGARRGAPAADAGAAGDRRRRRGAHRRRRRRRDRRTEPPPAKDVAPLVKQVFEQPFPFCTKPTYPLTPDEHKWCALIPKDDTRCPELAKACGRGRDRRGSRGPRSARARVAAVEIAGVAAGASASCCGRCWPPASASSSTRSSGTRSRRARPIADAAARRAGGRASITPPPPPRARSRPTSSAC